MRYVIVGNGIAATKAVEAIREKDRQGKIIVISDEPYVSYSRPLISYLLGKKVDLKSLPFRSKKFYQENKVELILNRKATRLDTKRKYVVLSNQQKIYFDQLLIATGGSPIIPPIKGANLAGVFTFTKLGDALKIEKYIKKNRVKEATVIGAGLIGLKATEALMELKIKVTIVELTDRILSASFDQKASGVIKQTLEKVGCKLITHNTVSEIEGRNKKVKGVALKDKRKIPADLVIVAIGVKPDIELVENTAIKTNKGILVDKYMQTNIKDIYAAGDCCGPPAIWPVAAKQGKIAGCNMVGEKRQYTGSFTMNSIELCGIPTISVGTTNPEGENYQISEYFDRQKNVYKKVVLKDNKIAGTIFVGEIERSGIYTGLIKDRVDVRSFKQSLFKDDFGLVCLPQEYRKHLVSEEVAII